MAKSDWYIIPESEGEMVDWETGDVEDSGEEAEGEGIGVFEIIVDGQGMNDEDIGWGER